MNESVPIEQSVELAIAKTPFHGTLTLPQGADSTQTPNQHRGVSAVVLLLPDSGALDRNHNSVQVQLNISNDIANYLAAHGIASVRFDKRGCGLSKGNFDSAGHSDLVADAQVWLDYICQHSPLAGAPVFILGHGEGSLIAPQLCAANPEVQGQILLMPFVENFENVIRRQAENALREIAELEGFKGKLIRFFIRLSGNQMKKQRKLINKIRKTRRATLKIRKQVINAKWIREMVNLDAGAIHGAVTTPTLIIGGQKDLQCLPGDVEKIAALVQGPVQSHVLSDLTHILRPDPEKPSIQHYLMLSLEEVDRRVVGLVQRWLDDQTNTDNTDATQPA